MTARTFVVAAAILGSLKTLSAETNPSETLVVKLGTLAPESSIWGKHLRQFRRTLYLKTRQSTQRIRLQIYYGGVQGDEIEMTKKIRYGQLHGGFLTGNGLGEACPETRLLDLPFLFQNYQEADFVYQRIRTPLNQLTMKKGFFLAAIGSVGYVYFFSKKPIKNLADIRRTKAWIWKGDALVHEAMKVMQIPGVAVSLTEVSTALQTGLVNTVYSTPTGLIALQWHKHMTSMLDLRLTLASSGLILSKKTWERFSEANQTLFMEALAEGFRKLVLELRASDAESLRLLGEEYVRLRLPGDKPNQVQLYGEALRRRLREGNMFPEELLKKVEALLQTYRKNEGQNEAEPTIQKQE